MRISKVIKTDDEIMREMKADMSLSNADRSKVLEDRKANAQAIQSQYDKGVPAPFIKPVVIE